MTAKLEKSERRAESRRRKRRESQIRTVRRIQLVAISVVLIAAAVIYVILRPRPGESVAIQGRQHVPVGVPLVYESSPPTSGPHYSSPAPAGVYQVSIEDGYLVHSLEHGYVVISYDCGHLDSPESGCDQLTASLTALARGQRLWKLILVPRMELSHAIVLTAWGRIDRLETFDERRITAFIGAWRDHGAEATDQ